MKIFIRKYRLPLGPTTLPAAPVLAVAFQHGELTIWLETPDRVGIVPVRRFLVLATGRSADVEGFEHVGSAVSEGLVWHVYAERGEPWKS